jgi:hypothetical protein
VSGLASKPLERFLPLWPQNLLQRFSPVWPQNWWRRFLPVWPQNRWSVPQNQGGGGFSGLGLKTGSFGLVIWASKSPRRFLGLGLKTKQASVCRLRRKTDGWRSAQDTCRDLAACLAWKQVWLGFPSLPKDWRRHDDGWCTWHHRGACIGGKLKMDGSI